MMLRLEDIHTYYGKSHILQGVSLEVGKGEIVALIGRNGVGKTTTMKTIMGLTPPRHGRTFVDGAEVTGLPPYKLAAAGVGFVPENRQVFPRLSVLQNLRIGLDIGNADEATKQKNLGMIYESFPQLEERARQQGSTLSGGEQQMLAIARAVVTRPKIILLDEPTEGLMPAMVQEIERIIVWMAQELGITVLLVEQDHHLSLRVSGRCYVMEKGRIQHTGESDALANDPDTLRALLGVA
jgi:branched-chain amino acid transport system ATP-binding protein